MTCVHMHKKRLGASTSAPAMQVQCRAHAGPIGHHARALWPRKDVGLQVVHVRVPEIQAPSLICGYQVLAALLRATQKVRRLPGPYTRRARRADGLTSCMIL